MRRSPAKVCEVYHTELARLNGASESEIEDAVHYAKSSVGWSTYLNGMQIDYDTFRNEVLHACDHVRAMNAAATMAGEEKSLEPATADF